MSTTKCNNNNNNHHNKDRGFLEHHHHHYRHLQSLTLQCYVMLSLRLGEL